MKPNPPSPKQPKIPVLGFTGFSGSGKTTILTQVIRHLEKSGKTVAVIKHSHHRFDIDKKGKDSYKFRASGAQQVIVASQNRYALMVEKKQEEPDLTYLINKLDLEGLDLILFEGFKHENYPKIEVHQKSQERPLLYPKDSFIIALATDDLAHPAPIPILDIHDISSIFEFVEQMI